MLNGPKSKKLYDCVFGGTVLKYNFTLGSLALVMVHE